MIIEDACTSATGRNLSATVVRGYSGRRSIKESLPMWYGKTVRNACAPSINCYSVYKICPGKWQIIWLHLHKTVQQIQCWYVSPAWRNADGGRENKGRGGTWTRKEVCLKKQKKVDEKAHDGAATPRVVLLLLLLLSRSSSGERQRHYIYIHSVQRISNGVDVGGSILSFMQGKSTTPLFRKAKCYSRIVLGETLLLIFKFEDGKVARERGPPPQERMGQMNEWERERYEGAGLLANNQNGWLIQMESGYT